MEALRLLLAPQVLAAAYSRQDLPRKFPMTEAFWAGSPEQIDGDSYDLIFDPEEQQALPVTSPGSSARVVTLGGGTQKRATLHYMFNKTALTDLCLDALREPASAALQNMGRTEVEKIIKRFKMRHSITKEFIIARSLAVGHVYFDALGNPLNDSTGALLDVDLNLPSTNTGNVNGLISALFSTAATDIPAILEDIKDMQIKAGVEEPTEIYFNAYNLKHLRNNTKFQDWAQNNPAVSDTILKGGMIEGLWGFNWHPVGGYWKATNGTKYDIFPKTVAVICPKPGSWLRCTAGSNLVPKDLNVQADAMSALSKTEKAYGEFGYAKLIDDPWRLMVYLGEKFGFNFADEGAVIAATAFSGS